MKVSIIICSFSRPGCLHDTVVSVLKQTHSPEEILIACPSLEHVQQRTLELETVRFVKSDRGSTIQRNAALDQVNRAAQLVAFLDDDIELCPSYFDHMVGLFSRDPELVVASGKLLLDGGRGDAVAREEARSRSQEAEVALSAGVEVTTKPLDYGYGCNMIVRADVAMAHRFDERLALYAWLEDSDYSHRCTVGRKPPVINMAAQCVHLGYRGGRISGTRMGFAQIINPIYLWRKTRVFSFRHLFVQYWCRCFVANCFGVIWGKPEDERLRRLYGNGIAFWHLLTGRCDPIHVKDLV
jgi:glycosyltransferase involved in cell wall biosynthesis